MKTNERIVYLREQKNLSQLKLANLLNVDKSVMNRIELGTRPLRENEIMSLAKIFNVSTDYLLGNQINNSKNKLEQTFEDTIEELKQEETLLFMKDGDIDEETARLVKAAMKNAMRMIDEMDKRKKGD